VLPGLFLLKNVAVTRLARTMACEGHGQGRDLANGIAAIMSILAKAARNKVGTQNREQGNRDQEDRRYSEKVLGILEVLHSGTGMALPSTPFESSQLTFRGYSFLDNLNQPAA
jgi:hypothetical protein